MADANQSDTQVTESDTEDADDTEDAESDVEESGPKRRRSRKPFSPEERQRIMRMLFYERGDGRHRRFTFMMLLSVLIAVMGMSLDSPAVVIGAMLIAPLMIPVMAFAVAVAMGWPRYMGRAGLLVLFTSVISILWAWGLAVILPDTGTLLTREVLSRTSPDVRDLLVGLAAGAAGGFAVVREDVSTALPGVAVAVALVPPVAAVGMALEAGQYDLAEGALLLYVANLVTILFSGIFVMLATGFVPLPHLTRVTPRIAVGVLAVLVATAAVGAPLAARSIDAVARADRVQAVNSEVRRWAEPHGLDIVSVDVRGDRVLVEVAGPAEPPPGETLAEALVEHLGAGVVVDIRWSQRSQVPTDRIEAAVGFDEADLTPIIDSWLDETPGDGAPLELMTVEIRDDEIVVIVAGPSSPPSAATLANRITTRLGANVPVTVRWIQRHEFTAEPGEPSPAFTTEGRIRAVAKAWVRDWPGVEVENVSYDGERAVIDLLGAEAPTRIRDLVEAVHAEVGDDIEVEVRFVERRRLEPEPADEGESEHDDGGENEGDEL